jgi:hypothetical protein
MRGTRAASPGGCLQRLGGERLQKQGRQAVEEAAETALLLARASRWRRGGGIPYHATRPTAPHARRRDA